ncbi:MAG: serine/threonine protein kinase [Clostridium sp.]|nr:serine/threonine protein kinase [Clostridium sp.]
MMRAGTVIGDKYEILEKIGQGGMSIVYVAMDTRLNKQWAVKEVINRKEQDTGELVRSLWREANILKTADHPVLPRIVDIINEKGTVFVVMDYIEGRTLSEILKTDGPQPQELVVEWAKDLCQALDYLHSMTPPIIYRDMKPSNIMVKPDGRVKLIDFGTAKEFDVESLADTTALGTRGYAAPEQFGDAKGRGIHKTDARTDIYSLGATLYHVLTGRNPSEPPYVIRPIREWNPLLSGGLEKLIMTCTMANPDNRYQNCKELFYALENYEKLDDAFRRESFRKMRSFLISAVFTLCFGITAMLGYVGNRREIRMDYENLLNEGYSFTVQGRYEEAVNVYVKAITEVDGRRNTAYLKLLDLYTDYMNDAETGLSRITYYIDQGKNHMDKDQELIFNVAMDYFELQKDYKTSAYYFNMLDEDEYPQTRYYSTIAMAMGELNVDYESLLEQLFQFETLNDNLTISLSKLINYKLLCIVYSRNLRQMEDAASHLADVAYKGLNLLEDYEDNSVKAEYYTLYNQHLASAYEALGDKALESDRQQAEQYYARALECCDFILGMVAANEDQTIKGIKDIRLREAKYCQKADIYAQLGDYEKACEVYENGEKEYYRNSIDLYAGHLFVLCKMQEQKTTDVEQWDYDILHDLYKEASRVPDIENDYRWKQMMQKLSPLFSQGSGLSRNGDDLDV